MWSAGDGAVWGRGGGGVGVYRCGALIKWD